MRKGLTGDMETVRTIFDRTDVLWLALTDENGPYCVPVNFVELENTIYIHSGKRGRKYEILRQEGPVSFSCSVDMELKKKETACSMGYRFKSVVGFGTSRLAAGEEARKGLDALVMKFAGQHLPYSDRELDGVVMFAIDITSVNARIKD